MSVSAIIITGFFIMLAVLGHTVWHGGEIAIANFIVSVFTGGRVSG